jgi:hypothetical protein
MFGASSQGLYSSIQVIGGFGLYVAGYTTARISTIRKFDFVTDAPATYTNTLPAVVDYPQCAANGTYGQIMGGDLASTSATTSNQQADFAAGTLTAKTALGTGILLGTGGSTVSHAYVFAGGTSEAATVSSRVQKYNYAGNNWVFNNASGLTWGTAVARTASHSNPATALIIGGTNQAISVVYNQVFRYYYNTDTGVAAGFSLGQAAFHTGASCGNQSVMFTIGAGILPAVTAVSNIYQYDMISGAGGLVANWPTNIREFGGIAGDDVRAVVAGGYNTAPIALTRDFVYNTYTVTSKTSVYSVGTSSGAAMHSMRVK